MKEIILAAAIALLPAICHAQAPVTGTQDVEALKNEIQRMKADIELMKGHIGKIVQYLQAREGLAMTPPQAPAGTAAQPASTVSFSIAGAPTRGRADAPVTMVEFSDFECPFCQRFFQAVLPALKRDYIDTGKMRYVFVDFPLEQIHPRARAAYEAAHCAAEQGKFWQMHDILFTNQRDLQHPQLLEHARKLGLDYQRFERCLGSGQGRARIEQGQRTAISLGFSATPSFVLARSGAAQSPNLVTASTRIVGSQPVETFRKAIEDLLTIP